MNYKIAPNTFRRLVYDNHARFQDKSRVNKFLEILNKLDPAIKYTAEFEDHKYSLDFLDINITSNTTNKKYCNYTNSKKIPWVSKMDQKIGKNLKR